MTTTKRNQDVPGFNAGDAQDMHTMANSYGKKKNEFWLRSHHDTAQTQGIIYSAGYILLAT